MHRTFHGRTDFSGGRHGQMHQPSPRYCIRASQAHLQGADWPARANMVLSNEGILEGARRMQVVLSDADDLAAPPPEHVARRAERALLEGG